MSALRWAAATAVAGALAAQPGVAAAQDPAPPSAATPPTATPSPIPLPTPPPNTPGGATQYVVTVTNTNTTVNAPITWIAAPITTNLAAGARANPIQLDLTGCRRGPSGSPSTTSRVRVPGNSTIALRVNGRSVGTLQLAGGAGTSKGIPLTVQMDPSGRLTVDRPSGRILQVQACSAK
jgi:hypothetical protein